MRTWNQHQPKRVQKLGRAKKRVGWCHKIASQLHAAPHTIPVLFPSDVRARRFLGEPCPGCQRPPAQPIPAPVPVGGSWARIPRQLVARAAPRPRQGIGPPRSLLPSIRHTLRLPRCHGTLNPSCRSPTHTVQGPHRDSLGRLLPAIFCSRCHIMQTPIHTVVLLLPRRTRAHNTPRYPFVDRKTPTILTRPSVWNRAFAVHHPATARASDRSIET